MKNRPQDNPRATKLTRYHLDSQQAAASKRGNGRYPEPPTYRRFSSKTMFPSAHRARSHQLGLSDRPPARYSSLHSFSDKDIFPIIAKNTGVCQQKCFWAYRDKLELQRYFVGSGFIRSKTSDCHRSSLNGTCPTCA